MHAKRLVGLALVAFLIASGCAGTVGVTVNANGGGNGGGNGKGKGDRQADARPTAGPATSPTSAPLAAKGPADMAGYTGRVLGLDGKPAVGVEVRGFLIANHSGKLVSNNGGSVIANNGGSLISDRGSGLVGQTRVPYVLAGLEEDAKPKLVVKTDEHGRFKLQAEAGALLNVEAVAKPDMKAIRMQVAAGTEGIELQLAPTGTITGKVTAPDAPTVTNFEGVDVYVPGTSYLAKADQAGRYVLADVPIGKFSIVASKSGLGQANVHDVGVESQATTEAPELRLTLKAPTITAIEPGNAAPGAQVTIKGTNFNAASGDTLRVTFKGAPATDAKRLGDDTIAVTVPQGAGSGEVVVEVAQIGSNGVPFQVIKSIAIKNKPTAIRKGKPFKLELVATDTEGAVVAKPAVKWSASADTLSVADTGEIVANAAGQFVVKVASGAIGDEATFEAVDAPYEVRTLAGGAMGYREGDRLAAQFRDPVGCVLMPDGTLYVAESGNRRLRKLTPEGKVSSLAGSAEGFNDGPLGEAMFADLMYVAADKDGNLYVTEYAGNRVRKISGIGTPQAKVETLAGATDGATGYVDGPGLEARFNGLKGIAVAKNGDVYVADAENSRIRRIRQSEPGNPVTTVVGRSCGGNGAEPDPDGKVCGPVGLAIADDGTLYVADLWNNAVHKVDTTKPDHPLTTFLDDKKVHRPGALALDAKGNLYVTEPHEGDHRILRFTPTGERTVVAGASGEGAQGDLDGPSTRARFHTPTGLVVRPDGRIVVVDRGNHRLRELVP